MKYTHLYILSLILLGGLLFFSLRPQQDTVQNISPSTPAATSPNTPTKNENQTPLHAKTSNITVSIPTQASHYTDADTATMTLPYGWEKGTLLKCRVSPGKREYMISHSRFSSPVYVAEKVRLNKAGSPEWETTDEYIADQILLTTHRDPDEFSPLLGGKTERVFGDRIYQLHLPESDWETVPSAVENAIRNGIHTASPNKIYRSAGIEPNDPRYNKQWHHAMVESDKGWTVGTGTGSIIVAVVDGGTLTTHEDLVKNLWINDQEKPNNNRDDDNNGYIDDYYGWNAINRNGNVTDLDGHGTGCAGIIGAVGNNSKGVSGMAWKTKIMTLRFMKDGVGDIADAMRCYDYARLNGAKIISCSFGYSGTRLPSEEEAVKELRDDGIILVAAAGNSRRNIDNTSYWPASYNYDNIVAVASTNESDNLSDFSSFGAKTIDIAAPGEYILTTDALYTTAYSYFSGTSAATPLVAGALALLRAQPRTSYQTAISKIISTADKIPALQNFTRSGGRLNIGKALGAKTTAYPTSPVTEISATQGKFNYKTDIEWKGPVGLYYRVYRSHAPHGEKILISNWIRASIFSDFDIERGAVYYYWVRSGKDKYGRDAGSFSDAAIGYSGNNADSIINAWSGIVFTLPADSIRITPPITEFKTKPSFRVESWDMKGVRKKNILRTLNTFPADTAKVEFNSNAFKLYDLASLNKLYYQNGNSVSAFLDGKNQLPQLPMIVSGKISQSKKAVWNEAGFTLKLSPPKIETDSFQTPYIESDSQRLPYILSGQSLILKGHYFGKTKPKVWIEVPKNSGHKIVRYNLKVESKPLYPNAKTVPLKSYTDPESGLSQISLKLPKIWPKWVENGGKFRLVIDSRIGLAYCDVWLANPPAINVRGANTVVDSRIHTDSTFNP